MREQQHRRDARQDRAHHQQRGDPEAGAATTEPVLRPGPFLGAVQQPERHQAGRPADQDADADAGHQVGRVATRHRPQREQDAQEAAHQHHPELAQAGGRPELRDQHQGERDRQRRPDPVHELGRVRPGGAHPHQCQHRDQGHRRDRHRLRDRAAAGGAPAERPAQHRPPGGPDEQQREEHGGQRQQAPGSQGRDGRAGRDGGGHRQQDRLRPCVHRGPSIRCSTRPEPARRAGASHSSRTSTGPATNHSPRRGRRGPTEPRRRPGRGTPCRPGRTTSPAAPTGTRSAPGPGRRAAMRRP